MGRQARVAGYTETKAREILLRLSRGEPLARICREEGMPEVQTVSHWKKAHAEFAADFKEARELGADAIACECLEIADTPVEGSKTKVNKAGEEITTEDMLGHRRLQIETRLKLLAKWFPQRYGDKLEVEAKHEAGESFLKMFEEIRSGQ